MITHLETKCPNCKAVLDTHVSEDAVRPKPLDLNACWDCGYLSTYADDLQLRNLTKEEYVELKETHPHIWDVLEAVTASAKDPFQAARIAAAMDEGR